MVQHLTTLIAVISLVYVSQCAPDCITYLQSLQQLLNKNQTQFVHTMMPYLVLSGKTIDDLGFPGSCLKDAKNYSYSTVQVTIQANGTQYTGYLGFCFTAMCPVQDLNAYAEYIIDFIFAEYPYGVSGKFIVSPLQLQFSPAALAICLIFLMFLLVTMVAPIKKWVEMCKQPQDSEYAIKSVYIDLQKPDVQLDQQRITQTSTTMERLSLKYKWNQLWKEEQTYKIFSFSLFRVLAVPLLLYGQIFWLTNFGAFNYYAYYEEIYEQFYVKFAIFSYYIPDIFFFISGFLFTKKILSFTDNHYKNLFKAIGHKLLRLYPLYIVVFIIYWGVSPALHAGPVWYVYEEQAQICNTAWWRILLMIDNWWSEGCYPALWFVQVQVQYTIVISILFFTIYLKYPKFGSYLLFVYLIATFIILFVFSAQMLVSVEIAIDPYTELYYKSFYSHIWFYLVGVLFGIIAQKESIRLTAQEVLLSKPVFRNLLKIIAAGLLVLILLRPWVWWGHKSLLIQLALCRYGTLLCFIILFLRGMFVKETYSTVIHKYGYYMYPVILVSYMVAQSSFWSVGSFMYVSGYDILAEMIPNFLISYALGIFLGLFFDIRTLMIK